MRLKRQDGYVLIVNNDGGFYMKKWLMVVSVAMAVTSSAANSSDSKQAVVGNPEAGKTKGGLCTGCHGADGNSPNPLWPNLAGQHASYTRQQIMDFQAGTRQDPMMTGMAASITTPQDMADLAAYFNSQVLVVPGTLDPQSVKAGLQLFRGGNATTGVAACIGCHGPDGMGNPLANFPRIAGQNVDYVVKALKDFRAGNRTNDVNGMMRGVTARMTDAEINAVAQYVRVLTN